LILRDREYLEWLKGERCIVTGSLSRYDDAIDPAHIGTAGRGIKSPDDEVLPMLHSEHMKSHAGDVTYWTRVFENDPHLLRLCLRAYARQVYKEWKDETHIQED